MSEHNHHHHQSNSNLRTAFFLNLGFTIVEVIGGILVNSVAILSDALHDLGDSISLGISWFLNRKAAQAASKRFTFGYSRFTLLGALVNSIVLLGGSIYVITEAIERFSTPEESNAPGMVAFALLGIAVNGYAAWRLSRGKTLNERVVSWHLIEDVLGWVAVLIVAVVLLFKNVPFLDPALSILVTLYVLYNVIKRLKETFEVFLQGVPQGIDPEKIKREISGIRDVDSLHHTHVWSLDGEHHVFTTHLKLRNIRSFSQIMEVKRKAREILKQYAFSHYTIEIELNEETCELASGDKSNSSKN